MNVDLNLKIFNHWSEKKKTQKYSMLYQTFIKIKLGLF